MWYGFINALYSEIFLSEEFFFICWLFVKMGDSLLVLFSRGRLKEKTRSNKLLDRKNLIYNIIFVIRSRIRAWTQIHVHIIICGVIRTYYMIYDCFQRFCWIIDLTVVVVLMIFNWNIVNAVTVSAQIGIWVISGICIFTPVSTAILWDAATKINEKKES